MSAERDEFALRVAQAIIAELWATKDGGVVDDDQYDSLGNGPLDGVVYLDGQFDFVAIAKRLIAGGVIRE